MPLKIYCEISDGASTWVRTGWKNVFENCGHNFIFFREHSNVFDLFNKLGRPDILIATTYNFNNSLFKLTKKYPETKVILFGSAFGPLLKEIDLSQYPIDYAKQQEKDLIKRLKNETGKPDFIFIHTPDFFVDKILGGWEEEYKIPVYGIMNAADPHVYFSVSEKSNRYTCDIGYVGGYWPYKARSLDKYISRLCNEKLFDLNIKIFGNGWNLPQHLGNLNFGDDNLLFNNSKICINISEEHSYIFPDFIERLFKCPIANGFLISDNVKDIERIYPNGELPVFKTYEEMIGLIDFYLKNDEERNNLLNKQKTAILSSHTYYHRINKMLTLLNLEDEANNILKNYEKLLGFN